MNADPKTEKRSAKTGPEAARGEQLLTSRDVAVLLGVSLRTLERMIHDEEIRPVRLRGWSVRFRMEDVRDVVRNGGRKWGRNAALAENSKEAA